MKRLYFLTLETIETCQLHCMHENVKQYVLNS